MDYEYKCVGAPERPKRSRRAKTPSDRVARAMEEIIQKAAGNGWEYLRTDLVPVTEKSSFLGRAQEVHRAVMVFRRELESRRDRPAERSRHHEAAGELFSEAVAERTPQRRGQTIIEEPPEPVRPPEPVQAREPVPAREPPQVREPAPAAERTRRHAPVEAPEPAQPRESLQLRQPEPAPEPVRPPDPAPAPEPVAAPDPAPASDPKPETAPEAAQDRPRRARAVPAEEPFFQALEKVTGPPRGGKGRDRSPPSGLG